MKRFKRRILFLPVALILCFASAVAFINIYVWSYAAAYIHSDVESLPKSDTAIVPGARVYGEGKMSNALYDRMATALALYRNKKVSKILVTGVRYEVCCDEVKAMRDFLLHHGVGDSLIMVDGKGVNTSASMLRAISAYKIKNAVVVTQKYHLSRSVYLARTMGIDATGFPADRRTYKKILWYSIREIFATVKDFAETINYSAK